ncbi:MAG: B12-binding domain-containing radical SAM protein, partial [Ignavibacteria bacterium]
KDIEETIYHLKKSNPDHFTITVAYPIKGTEFYQEIETQQTGDFSWEKQTDRERDFKRTYPRKYYNYAVQRVHSEFNYYKLRSENHSYSIPAIKFKMKSILAKARMQIEKAKPH